jgi:cellulose synthase/poly-beta-1,6-N-acetylglucosamine synthase-like glycosyltransferase
MISFVIPAHDEEVLLGATLRALHAATRGLGEPTEVIVVDDASTDRTADVAREHGARVVPVACRQISGARNAGAGAAMGDLLVFVDADTIVGADVVQAAVAAMRAGAAGGGCAFRFDGRVPLWGRLLATTTVRLYRAADLASGCFLFCTRAAFLAAGGFDESLFGAEEMSMSRRVRRQGRFVVLRETVTTSGRKLRAYSGRESLRILARLVLGGRRAMRQRDGLDVWYGKRRSDPDAPDTNGA